EQIHKEIGNGSGERQSDCVGVATAIRGAVNGGRIGWEVGGSGQDCPACNGQGSRRSSKSECLSRQAKEARARKSFKVDIIGFCRNAGHEAKQRYCQKIDREALLHRILQNLSPAREVLLGKGHTPSWFL